MLTFRPIKPMMRRAALLAAALLAFNPEFAARALSALRMFFRFLESEDVAKNRAILSVAMPKVPHSIPRPLTIEKALAVSSDTKGAEVDWIAARDIAEFEVHRIAVGADEKPAIVDACPRWSRKQTRKGRRGRDAASPIRRLRIARDRQAISAKIHHSDHIRYYAAPTQRAASSVRPYDVPSRAC